MIQNKPRKQKKCKNPECTEKFVPRTMAHIVCSPYCALQIAAAKREKAEKKDIRERREKLKTRSDYLRELQVVVNKYVRIRDTMLGCVSCDRLSTWDGQWHGSHFRSVAAASAVRFNLWNINKSCSICNNWKSGNLSEYEPRLRAKIGNEKVDWLRSQNHRAEYSVEYLIRFKKIFLRKIKRLEMMK